ncbi:hypothetical protein BAU15_09440 [Enterococcus sp. JM4C]|uniref:cytidylate kinase family protein n=1 Tax=Candidatus Enterococcus huntleyi TaxID=1857217 RepID=UPI001379480D|nr:cytidylate kinase family protein [Enterococcus sp. JM4C]KAF1298064.1 hypothetical protein BAU15_09440 [Enterococcus sp. JM4C]
MKHIFLDSEYCSMGRWIGVVTAKVLGITFCDDVNLIERIGDPRIEKNLNLLNLNLENDAQSFQALRENENFKQIHSTFNEEIRNLLKRTPCLIHERGNENCTEDRESYLSVMIYSSSIEEKSSRVILDNRYEACDFSKVELEAILKKEDRARELYTNASYNRTTWGKKEAYDLCLNTAYLSKEQCVEILVAAVSEQKMKREEFNKIVTANFGRAEE